jgi:hypothetical protein
MPTKYELVKRTKLMTTNISINTLIHFIVDIFLNVDKAEFFLSIDTTLFFYNCLFNSSMYVELNNKKIINQTIHTIYEKVFEITLNDQQKIKINKDIDYIIRYKLYTKISYLYYYSFWIYDFFFRPQIYIVGEK